jgi:hypothetical protein
MKKRKALLAVAVTAVAGGVSIGIVSQASAADDGVICMTKDPTPFYSAPTWDGGQYWFTIPADSGYRLTGRGSGVDDKVFVEGHPNGHSDGWVLDSHLRC